MAHCTTRVLLRPAPFRELDLPLRDGMNRHWCRELRANDRYAKSDFNLIRKHIGTDDQRHWLRMRARSTIECGD